jgi:hypothetical protein
MHRYATSKLLLTTFSHALARRRRDGLLGGLFAALPAPTNFEVSPGR